MSCKYLQGFIDSISGWLLFVTVVWMVAVGMTNLLLGGCCRSCLAHVSLGTTHLRSHYEANGQLILILPQPLMRTLMFVIYCQARAKACRFSAHRVAITKEKVQL